MLVFYKKIYMVKTFSSGFTSKKAISIKRYSEEIPFHPKYNSSLTGIFLELTLRKVAYVIFLRREPLTK